MNTDPKISEYSASDSNFGGNEKNMNQYQFDALKLWMGSVVNPTAGELKSSFSQTT
jgi:hypothetical protein